MQRMTSFFCTSLQIYTHYFCSCSNSYTIYPHKKQDKHFIFSCNSYARFTQILSFHYASKNSGIQVLLPHISYTKVKSEKKEQPVDLLFFQEKVFFTMGVAKNL